MPEVKGFYKENIIYNHDNIVNIKLNTDLEEIKDCPYELIYELDSKYYSLIFKFNDEVYCLDIKERRILRGEKSFHLVRYNFDNKKFEFMKDDQLGGEIYKLCLRIGNVIKNNTNERIKFLVNKSSNIY